MPVDDLGKLGMRMRAARNEMGLTQQRLSDVRLVYVSADHKGMIAFSKTLCKFYAQPVCFFRGNLTGAEGLAHMIGNHIICATHSSGSGNVLPLSVFFGLAT